MAFALKRVTSTFSEIFYQSLLSPKQCLKPQIAGMRSKIWRGEDYKREQPFDYKNEKYGFLANIFEDTSWRFDEYSKLIVVDGPMTSEKARVSKEIAEAFDLHHIQSPNFDHYYVNGYGFDLRTVNDQMPFKFKSFEPKDFIANPYDPRAAILQRQFFELRLIQYVDALNHIFNTGQGVVMNRSVYSDFVFGETFMKMGFLPKTLAKIYRQTWMVLKPDLLAPHLIVYLDTPVDVIIENLKKRDDQAALKSPVYQPKVLKELEHIYKNEFLKKMSAKSEILVYDWTEPVDTEVLVEDIEMVDLEQHNDKYSPKMKDWLFQREHYLNHKRAFFSARKDRYLIWARSLPVYDCEEIFYSGEDWETYNSVVEKTPGGKYEYGYNADMGDSFM